MTVKIWTYWEDKPGKKRTPLQDLCFETLKRNNPGFRVVGPEDIRKMGGGSVLKLAEGVPIPQRSDLIRLWLLHKKGGVWVDADTVATGPFEPSFIEAIECGEYELVGHWNPAIKKGWGCDGLLATPFGGPAGSQALLEGFKRCRGMIENMKNGKGVPYGQSSVGLLSQLYKQQTFKVRRFEHWRLSPIPWFRAGNLFRKERRSWGHEIAGCWNPNACVYHLTNVPADQFKNATREELLKGKSFLSFIIQKGLCLHPAVPFPAIEILKRLPDGPARMVELGVLRGSNPRNLLHQKKDLQYIGVDPWKKLPPEDPDSKGSALSFDCRQWPRIMGQAQKLLQPFDDRVKLYRQTSMQAIRAIKPRSVDLVFIDACHSFPCVRDDLHWENRIKPGGWICGHDYDNPGRKGYGVNKAVDQFAKINGLELETGEGMTWFVRIPKKELKQLPGGTS
jgi:hypothetical protein